VKSSGIPPFANSAKDGAPDPLWQAQEIVASTIRPALVFITLGEPQPHGQVKPCRP